MPWEAINDAFSSSQDSVDHIDAARQALAEVVAAEKSQPASALYLEAAATLPYCDIFEAWAREETPEADAVVNVQQQLGELLADILDQNSGITDMGPETRDHMRRQMALLLFVRLSNSPYLAYPAPIEATQDEYTPFHIRIPHRHGITPARIVENEKRLPPSDPVILPINLPSQIYNIAAAFDELDKKLLSGRRIGNAQRAVMEYTAALLVDEAQGKELLEMEANFLDDISFALCERAETHWLEYNPY